MKVIIAGSREINSYAVVEQAVRESNLEITEVVSGCARGVDRLGEAYAIKHRLPIAKFPANWDLGRGAGHIRNAQMAEYAEALIAIWDGSSRGTAGMIRIARANGLQVYVKTL